MCGYQNNIVSVYFKHQNFSTGIYKVLLIAKQLQV